MQFVAVVKYHLGADREDQARALIQGLSAVAAELAILGVSRDHVEQVLEDAIAAYDEERDQ